MVTPGYAIFSVVLVCLTAFLTAFLTAKFSLTGFFVQRSWERKADAYNRLIETTHDISTRMRLLQSAIEAQLQSKERSPDVKEAMRELNNSTAEATKAMGGALLLISDQAKAQIKHVSEVLRSTKPYGEFEQDTADKIGTAAEFLLVIIARLLDIAEEDLGREARASWDSRLLGLDEM